MSQAHTPKPILDQFAIQFTPGRSASPGPGLSTKKPIFLYVVIGILAFVALLAICLLVSKQVLGDTNLKTLLPLCVVPTGYLQANKDYYINVNERIFPDHPNNLSMSLTLTKDPKTVWIQEFVDENRTQFVFKTEINGLMFSLQIGPPGTGTEWGIAFVAPIVRAVNSNVILKNNQSSMVAITPAWPENCVFLSAYQDKPELYWTSSPGDQLSSLKLVQT